MSESRIVSQHPRQLDDRELQEMLGEMERLVHENHLFRSLNTAAREQLLKYGQVIAFEAGSVIVRQGEPGDTMYIVLRGQVAVEAETGRGPMRLAELGPHACIGEVSFLSGGPRSATVTALSKVDAVQFERNATAQFLHSNPGLRGLLEKLVQGRAADAFAKFVRG